MAISMTSRTFPMPNMLELLLMYTSSTSSFSFRGTARTARL